MNQTLTTPFAFNRDYGDFEQVAHLVPAYETRLAELRADDKYPYNSSFKGHLGGTFATDDDEESAVYLLQKIQHRKDDAAKRQGYLDAGHRVLGDDETGRFASIIIIRTANKGSRSSEFFEFSRVEQGRVQAVDGKRWVMRKGARNRGWAIDSATEVLVK